VQDFMRRHRNKRRTSPSPHDPKLTTTTTALTDDAESETYNQTGGSYAGHPDLSHHQNPVNRDPGHPDLSHHQNPGNRDPGAIAAHGDTNVNRTQPMCTHPDMGSHNHAKARTDTRPPRLETGSPRLDETQYTPKELWARSGFIRDTHDTSSAEDGAEHNHQTRFDQQHDHGERRRGPWGTHSAQRDDDLTTLNGLHSDSESEGGECQEDGHGMDGNVHDASQMQKMYEHVFQKYMQNSGSGKTPAMDPSELMPAKQYAKKMNNRRTSGVRSSKDSSRRKATSLRDAGQRDGHDENTCMSDHKDTCMGDHKDTCMGDVREVHARSNSNRRSNSTVDESESESESVDGDQGVLREGDTIDERLDAMKKAIKAADAPYDVTKLSMKDAFVCDSSDFTSSKDIVDEGDDELHKDDDDDARSRGDESVVKSRGDDDDDGMTSPRALKSRGDDGRSRGDITQKSLGDDDVPGESGEMPRDRSRYPDGGVRDTGALGNSGQREGEDEMRSRGHDGGVRDTGALGNKNGQREEGDQGEDEMRSRGHGDMEHEFDHEERDDGKQRDFDDEERERAYFLRRDVLFAQQYNDIVKHFEEQLRYVCVHAFMCVYACVKRFEEQLRYVCVHAFMCVCVCMCMHTQTHIQKYTSKKSYLLIF
jgi:hypothetical protein